MAKELDSSLHSQIAALCEKGDELASRKDYNNALIIYNSAWDLLPDPKVDWEAAMWIQSAIGDALFLSQEYQKALQAFSLAVQCPSGLGNPFIHLRLGECHCELGETGRALDELTRAYMGADKEIFANEDPKYFELLESALKPPLGRSSL